MILGSVAADILDAYTAGFTIVPPSFIKYAHISTGAPVLGRGLTTVTFKIDVASNATIGTYTFAVRYIFSSLQGALRSIIDWF